jgi:hypothetical protein
LIFLISFAMVHFTSYLARRRGDIKQIRFRTPHFPLPIPATLVGQREPPKIIG